MGQAMLKRLGCHVTTRIHSLDALPTFQSQQETFDQDITNQTMPGTTGPDLARCILHVRPDMPRILYTGYSSLVPDEKARAAGVKGIAIKSLAKKGFVQHTIEAPRLRSGSRFPSPPFLA